MLGSYEGLDGKNVVTGYILFHIFTYIIFTKDSQTYCVWLSYSYQLLKLQPPPEYILLCPYFADDFLHAWRSDHTYARPTAEDPSYAACISLNTSRLFFMIGRGPTYEIFIKCMLFVFQ